MALSVAMMLLTLALSPAAGAQQHQIDDVVKSMRAIRNSPQGRRQRPASATSARPHVVLNRFVCEGVQDKGFASPAELQRDLQEAQTAFAACGVDVRLGRDEKIFLEDGGSCPSNFRLVVDHESKTLSPSERSLFGRYHRAAEGLSVFYLPISSMGPRQAGTSLPANYIHDAKDDNAQDRAMIGSLAVFPQARANMNAPWSLPHEMGHVLINGRPFHLENAPGNLMEAFATGRALTKEQCGLILESPFLRRD